MCKTHLKNDFLCSKNITFPQKMTNHIFEHPNVYFDFMFLYMDNTFLTPIMHIFKYIIRINIHN